MGEDLRSLGEFGLIERIRGRLPGGPGVDVGIGDDAAAVLLDREALLTTDMLVEKVHFDLDLGGPEEAGYKAVSSSASDIAAMGGHPRYAVISFGAPADTSLAVVDGIVDGIADAAAEFAIACVGGDTVSAPVIVISVTVAGDVGPAGPVRRSTARAGDLLCVTGGLGAAAAGLEVLRRGEASLLERFPSLVRAYLRGRARVREGIAAAGAGASAMIDVSDGVAADANHLAAESRIGLVLLAGNLPLAEGVAEVAALLGMPPAMLALSGGEDYELLIAVHPHDVDFLRSAVAPTPLTVIGEFAEGNRRDVEWPDGARAALAGQGWDHFK